VKVQYLYVFLGSYFKCTHVAPFKSNMTSAMLVVAAHVLGQFPVGSNLTNKQPSEITDNYMRLIIMTGSKLE
jgi:hypothetical protein